MLSDPMKPTVAVLLAAFNGMQWIEEQVSSILEQDGVHVVLFISVDKSTDGTYEWCKKLESERSNVHVLAYGERFGGAAKNFFRLIKDVNINEYDYVALSDQDDIWLSNKLSHAVNLIKNDSLDAVSSDVVSFWSDGREMLVKKSHPQKKFDYLFEAAGPGCSYVFKETALSDFKNFYKYHYIQINEISLHDWIIYAYFRSRGLRWHIDNTPLMRYRQHSSNQVGSNTGISSYIKRLKMVNSGWYRNEVKKIHNLVNLKEKYNLYLSRTFLIKNFYELRRRHRDAWILLLMILLGLF